MAHAATLSRLAESLVTATTGQTTNDPAFRRLRDQTLRGLKDQSHGRTNQFAVKDSFDGLVEKFTVLNREDLAVALAERLEELPTKSKWMPEISSLLLELSDRPVDNTKLEDVLNANVPEVSAPELTWHDIIADDPLDDPDIWDTVERGYHSSGDDEFEPDLDSEPTVSTKATSVHGDDPVAIARLHLMQPNETTIQDLTSARSRWKAFQDQDGGLDPSELLLVREILSMLHGLNTDLFLLEEPSGQFRISTQVRLSNTSYSSIMGLLNTAAKLGTLINLLRKWKSVEQKVTYLQAVVSTVDTLCSRFGEQLAALEQQSIRPDKDRVASANETLTQILNYATPLAHLSTLIQRCSGASQDRSPFALMDLLYEEANIAQMSGSQHTFELLADVLLAGLEAYLRPVAAWIKLGTLSSRSQDAFFVKESNQHCEAGNLWHGQYEMRISDDGNASAPFCVLPVAHDIFVIGKSKSFRRRLGDFSDLSMHTQPFDLQASLLSGVRQYVHQGSLVPFSQTLTDVLEQWIFSVGREETTLVTSALLRDHGLDSTLTAIPYVFFSKHGATFQDFADAVFDRFTKHQFANLSIDQFLFTELAQTTLGSPSQVLAENLSVSVREGDSSITASTVRRLESVRLGHHLSWPVQNVTRSESLETLSMVFALLLQTSYTTSKLSASCFDLRSASAGTAGVLALRQHLLCFANIIQDHITTATNVLHGEMQKQMALAADIDSMVAIWSLYEKRLKTTLLLSPKLEPMREAVICILELGDALSENCGPRSVAHLRAQLQKQLAFLIAGIRSVSRAGGEPSLEILAERLDWGVG